jgi:hypothetical protein
VPDGTVSAPGLAFTLDPDVGLYRPGTNQLGLTAGGVGSLIVTSTGITVSGVISGNGAVPAGGTSGQVLAKNSATNYDLVWQTPSAGLTLPLTQNLTFSPDNTYDIGASGATRPRNVYAAGAFIGNGSVPTGGTAGQVLAKNTATNYDLVWQTPSAGLTLPLSQNLTFSPDITYDIGTSGANRPRDLYLGRNALVIGNLSVLGASGVSTDVVNGFSGNIITTDSSWHFSPDNTYDIGASGATRPRDLFLGRNATIGGTLGVTGASTLAGLTCTTLTASGAATMSISLSSPVVFGPSNTLEVRNGLNAESVFIYGTYTDASNYERLELVTTGSGDFVQTNQLGTGTAKYLLLGTKGAADVRFSTNNTTRWTVDGSVGTLLPSVDNGRDIGSSSLRLRDVYVAGRIYAPDLPRANLLVNGGFEIWQRGTSGLGSGYGADRWNAGPGSGSSFNGTIARDSANADTGLGSTYCWSCTNYTHSAGSNLDQSVEVNGPGVRGRPVTFSMRVRTNVANHLRLQLIDVDGSTTLGTSGFHSGGNTYETLSVTGTPNATTAGGKLTCRVQFNATSTVNFLDNAMLVIGPVAVDYVPLPIADELHRCLRYYETFGGANSSIGIRAWGGDANPQSYGPIVFSAKKAVTPTLTKVGTWTASGCGQPTFDAPSVSTGHLVVTTSAAGAAYAYGTIDATTYLAAEANP